MDNKFCIMQNCPFDGCKKFSWWKMPVAPQYEQFAWSLSHLFPFFYSILHHHTTKKHIGSQNRKQFHTGVVKFYGVSSCMWPFLNTRTRYKHRRKKHIMPSCSPTLYLLLRVEEKLKKTQSIKNPFFTESDGTEDKNVYSLPFWCIYLKTI